MNTLKEIVYKILSPLNLEHNTEAYNRVSSLVHDYRAKLIRQKYNQNDITTDWNLDINVPVTRVKGHSICEDIGCTVVRTENKIPSPIFKTRRNGYVFVGSADFTHSYTFIDYSQVERALRAKWIGANEVFYSIRENYIYVYNADTITSIGISDPFSNPTIAFECCEPKFNEEDQYYPLPINMIDTVKGLIISQDLGLDRRKDDELDNKSIQNEN